MQTHCGAHGVNLFGLTVRELDIVANVVGGGSNRQIAHQCGITEKTVKRHLTNIFDKVGLSSRLELAMFALKHQLVADELGTAGGAVAGPLPRGRGNSAARAHG